MVKNVQLHSGKYYEDLGDLLNLYLYFLYYYLL